MNVAPHVRDLSHTGGEVTRPCRFGLRLQRGAVFADFDADDSRANGRGRVRLLRISFDGYGCCEVEGRAGPMSAADTALLLQFADDGGGDAGGLDAGAAGDVLRRYFAANRDVLWEDALADHGLLGGGNDL